MITVLHRIAGCALLLLTMLAPGGAARAGLYDYGPAPELAGIERWLNSEPLTLASLRGKVVLVDFWTYSCINCLRTLPHVKGWHARYKDQGLVVIGVHTPEFAFERLTRNVETAMRRFGVTYPVAQDNAYATWKAFDNAYWPAGYLIDRRGHIRLKHFGEGGYDEMDAAIRTLLAEPAPRD
jgi:thiol-disulfide isomerase/thioredoxin